MIGLPKIRYSWRFALKKKSGAIRPYKDEIQTSADVQQVAEATKQHAIGVQKTAKGPRNRSAWSQRLQNSQEQWLGDLGLQEHNCFYASHDCPPPGVLLLVLFSSTVWFLSAVLSAFDWPSLRRLRPQQ